MSIIISSDDSNDSCRTIMLNNNAFDADGFTKNGHMHGHMSNIPEENADVMDLTQGDTNTVDGMVSDHQQSPSLDNDAMFDEMFPPALLEPCMDTVQSSDSGHFVSTGMTTRARSSLEKNTRKIVGNKEENAGKKTSKNSRIAEEKSAKKQKLAEKAAKQAVSENNKIYKPGECMKYMRVEVHPSLVEAWYGADIPREVSAAGARVVTVPTLCDPGAVMWSRVVQPTLAARGGQVELSPSTERCSRALYIACAENVAEHVRDRSLSAHVANIQIMTDCKLTLVVFGVKDYFKPSRRTKSSRTKLMTEIDLEMAITDVLVTADCDTVMVNTPNELALLILQFTKAIAEAPYKQSKRAFDEQAAFYMRGDNKKCVAVDKDGHGLSRLWQQMIAILPSSSLETSRAICAQYKSPLELYEVLESSNSINELADIGVSRAAVPGSKARRVGPEFARKLHTLFTAEDGDTLLE